MPSLGTRSVFLLSNRLGNPGEPSERQARTPVLGLMFFRCLRQREFVIGPGSAQPREHGVAKGVEHKGF